MDFGTSVVGGSAAGISATGSLTTGGRGRGGGGSMQLPEAFDFFHRQIVAAQVQPGVKEHAAMPGRENEVIAPDPTRLVRVMLQGVAVKHCTQDRKSTRLNSSHLGISYAV